MNLKNKVVTLNNKKQYIVLETIYYKEKIYAYLINREEEVDFMFREIIMDNDLKLKKINKDLFEKEIHPLFLEKFKNNE